MFYDSGTDEVVFIENDAADSPGGAGIKAAQLVVDSGAGVLLTPRCGENAAEVMNAAGIKLFKTREGTAMDNIRAYLGGALPPLTESHPGFTDTEGRI
jgi:predicted Fe-Mo cluster-binding NifX family protein